MELINKLRALPERLETQRPTLWEIVTALDDEALALSLLLFSLPAIIPTPGVPAGMVFGSVLALLGLQMCLATRPMRMLPGLGKLSIDRGLLVRIIERAAPHLEKTRGWLRPRLDRLVTAGAIRAMGLVVCLMGILIALPIPFGNTLPGLAVLVLALGIAQKDGAAVLAGLGLTVIAGVASWAILAGSWWLVAQHFPF